MPFGEGSYKNDGTVYTANTPGGFGCVECKKMLERRAREKKVPIPPGFKATSLTFGASAEDLCSGVQSALGLPPDGICGPDTMRVGFKPDLRVACDKEGLQFEYLCKLVSLESSFNPSAFSPGPWLAVYPGGSRDRGICQINTQSGISDAEAFDVLKAFAYSADRLYEAIKHYDGELDVAVASYNVGPTGAFYYAKGRDYWNLYEKQTC